MQAVLPVILTLIAGLCVATQTPTNAMLARSTGSLWLAASVSFTGGTAFVIAAWALIDRTPLVTVRQAPPWAWVGGLYGAFFVAAVAFAAPRLGLALTLTLTITAQLIAAVVFDHFGLMGLDRVTITLPRVIGVLCILAGVLLVRK
ncbi:DMT family transporter [Sphingomonas psychrotolerans]|uniref:DMT family transporter n=1 Tax=Sphingomonas psychrotolerans TaxID=1327635 RepID=A0ABU3N3A7_9SPHN|nr:DMT family transporter [Sphingomonas psychrotolerans]MDT8757730.1 DMT family transporter [Sphingomonas psychrotolerans]